MARNLITPGGKQVRVEGLAELKSKIAPLMSEKVARDVKKIYMRGALILRDRARVLANWRHVREAIFAAYGKDTAPNVLVGVNYRRAPDAYWLEKGTYVSSRRWPKNHRFLKFFINGRVVFVTSVANLQPHPYMRPAVTQTRNEIVAQIAQDFRDYLTLATA